MWTQELPSDAGYYWIKSPSINPTLVQLSEITPPGVAVLRTALVCGSLLMLTGAEQWSGPIQPPE